MATTTFNQSPSNVLKIAFVGAECTGKTTLCQALARHFDTLWVPEYMRTYLQAKWDKTKQSCTWADLLPIALGQIADENAKACQAKQLLFCDTNLFELMVYSQLYYGKCPPEIDIGAKNHHYDVIFFTDIDVPWQADDLRDKPNERQAVFDFFADYLKRYHKPYVLLSGSHDMRFAKAVAVIDNQIKQMRDDDE